MIQFNAHRENRPTLFFMARQNKDKLLHVLEENMVTGWSLHNLTDIQHLLPDGTQIPPIYLDDESDRPVPNKAIMVFVSYYRPVDIQELLRAAQHDPDIQKWENRLVERTARLNLWRSKMEQDPDPMHTPFCPRFEELGGI